MKNKVMKMIGIALAAASLAVAVYKYDAWAALLPISGALCVGIFWVLREDEQYRRIYRLRNRIRKMRREMEASMEVDAA